MAEPGPATRFRAVALTVLAAAGVVLLIVLLAAGSFGLLPTPSGQHRGEPAAANDPALLATYGASGVVPQDADLKVTVVASGTTAQAAEQAGIPEGELTVPEVVLAAYQRAEEVLAVEQPACHLSWTLLAGIGRVISDHGAGDLDADGNTRVPILGPRLNGSAGLARIVDTDEGRLDGDPEWDRAVGPMQIIPTVWTRVQADHLGAASPHNIHDAALAAGRYLCENGADLREATEQAYSVFRYQRSESFVGAVLAWSSAYADRLVESDESEESEESEADEVPTQAAVPTTQAPRPRGEARAPAASPTPRVPSPSPTSVVPPTQTPTSTPTEPIDSGDPGDPGDPEDPGDPGEPGDSSHPDNPPRPTGPIDSSAPSGSFESAR